MTQFPAILFLLAPRSSAASMPPSPPGLNSAGPTAPESPRPAAPPRSASGPPRTWCGRRRSRAAIPHLAYGVIFLTGYYPQSASFAVFALNRHSGAVEWQREIAVDEVEKVHATSNPANATPATDGEHVRLHRVARSALLRLRRARGVAPPACYAQDDVRVGNVTRRCRRRRSAESRRQHAAAAAGHRPAYRGDGLGKL